MQVKSLLMEKRDLSIHIKLSQERLKNFFPWKGSPFFIGPKQIVCLSKPLDEKVIEKIERAFSNVEPF
jgi:hypothetical protein